jgi:nucleoid DNA-binding protein
MDIELISELLIELIMDNDRVSLPGMGSFIAEPAPSVFSDKATIIHPPYRRVIFRSKETWNDGLLESKYAQRTGVREDRAKAYIEQFISALGAELELKKRVDFPGFGYMRINERGTNSFIIDKELFISKDSYGLEPIQVKILEKPGTIENLKTRKLKIFSDSDVIKNLSKEKRGFDFKIPKSAVKWSLIIVGIALVILLLIIFNDQLRPLWEILLYNKEEREILRSIS